MSVLSSVYSLPGKGQVFLAAFGKHPGWSDFMDDLGMNTESLILTKRVLYLKGITSQIETGVWAKLEPNKSIADFNHLFLWRRADEFLIGRIWSSADAKGRKEYPMVACVDCIELPLAWVLQEVPSLLEEIRINCQAARTSTEVGNIMAAAQDTLRQRLANSTPFSVEAPDAQSVRARLLSRREWGPNQEGLHRILHQMHGQFMAFGLGQHQSFSETVFLRKTPHGGTAPLSQQIRVPQAADTPAASLRQWIDFFLHKLNPATPILLVNCLDQKWMDITIGEPSSREFFSIKASRAALPLANDVPYKMDEASQEFARDFIASYRMTTNGKSKPNRSTTYLLLGLLLLLILAALFLAYLQHASPGNIPEFLRGAARSLGNPRVAPSEK